MRKVQFLNSQNVDVLIVDSEGEHHIKQCIPDIASFSVLPVRNVIPLIASYSFVLRVLVHIIKLNRIQDAIIFSIIDLLQPKILITHIDTLNLMGRVHAEFPNKLTISVQNGWRSGLKYSDNSYSKYPVSLFYGFGEHDGRRMKNFGINNIEYVPSGSLVYGLYKKRFSGIIKNKYDLCYLSQFNTSEDAHMNMLMNYSDKIFLSLVKVSKELDLSLAVSMRNEPSSPNYIPELNHLSKIDTHGIAKLISNDFLNYEGYKIASQSNILIALNSTLAFEMFGAGSKVLFCGSANNFEFAHFWDAFDNFNKFPNINLLDNFSFDSMRSKLNFLIAMDTNEYIDKTESARKYYMNHLDTKATHELIKNKITEFLPYTRY